jgi:triosephosphate isomerase
MQYGPAQGFEFAAELRKNLLDTPGVQIILCPPFLALAPVCEAVSGSNIKVGAQNMHFETGGAFTGEITGAMIRETGAEYVILGHSERRHVFGETDEMIRLKVNRSLADGLTPILCVGEKLEERQADQTTEVVGRQLSAGLQDVSKADMRKVLIAYEPVWAIGTGLTATPEQADEVHRFIRAQLVQRYGDDIAETVPILYGGSVKPDNTKGLLSNEDIDGALVGGASLKVESFAGIVEAAAALS